MTSINIKNLEKTDDSLECAYNRVLNNCRFYEKENEEWSLMNEIGVLRGLLYAMQIAQLDFDISDAIHFIEKQGEFKERDK